ncbi:flagellar filament capping protein FliD [Novosphingobium sp. KCTC 2891]|uniref:flagellar filament capping protein FliD n=1 Tax=Novosphingobium sp. KCTC 2891 TaxID=2989730 RepID=UPI002223EA38|nr:flagellar filament capping protein FliD [Novosphingobium sp. KCTC 2891]MCW1383021.1 flagellar filament capping protein FliD [Novosphingobium sp. KCTC 2891]
MTTTSATSSTSATSKLVSALGGGSGIDTASLAEQLAAAQFASRLDQLSARGDKLTTQISAASTLKSMITTLASSFGDRVRTGDLAVNPQIANSAVATVTKGALTGSGTSSLEVTSLAKGQTLTTPSYAAGSTATVGSGTLTLRFGTISGTAFTADAARAQVDITVAQGATLDDVASAINAKGAGVTAYVATGTSGAQLVLKGGDGAANAFVLEAAEDPLDPGLADLAWTPAAGTARLKTAASDAAYVLDGVARTSVTNTITDAAPGLTLKLTGTNVGNPTTISFSDPASAIQTAMGDLVSALNEMMSELNKDTDPTSGTLNNDAGTRALRRSLSSLALTKVMPSAAAGDPSTLSDLGLKTNRDGTFALDTTRLSATLAASPTGAAAMFTTGLFGVYATLDKTARAVASSTDSSSLGGSVARMTTLQSALAAQRADLQTKQEDLRTKLVSRYAALDSRLSNSKSTLSFLQAQVAAWNAKSN